MAIRQRIVLTATAILLASCAAKSAKPDLDVRLAATPTHLDLGGTLHVVNLFRPEGLALLDSSGHSSQDIVDRLTRDVYSPWPAFWNGYLGDETAFRSWAAEQLLDPAHPIHHTLAGLLDAGIDSLFTTTSAWLERTAGRTPRGTWYLVYGPGWTDMGGLGEIGMVVDFTKQSTDRDSLAFLLPHELAHQVHGARPRDPDAGTVLDRTVGEGLASYVAWVHDGRRGSPARALGYTEEEWAWSLAHEQDLFAAIRPMLDSRERADVDLVASRSDHLLAGGPGAQGYFVGLRIVQAWTARHGEDQWPRLLDLSVRTVLEESGYAP